MQKEQLTELESHLKIAAYLAWRDRFIPRGVDLVGGLEALTDEELQRAWHELLPGVTAAKLNPKNPEFDGSFHLAAGVIMGIMHARKLNIPVRSTHEPPQDQPHAGLGRR